MQQDVYIDLYFLVNTGMDLLCLLISAAILHRRLRRIRTFLGAALGGLYAVAALLLGMGGVIGFLADCAFALLICGVAFSPFHAPPRRTLASLFRLTAVYILCGTLMGGIMTVLFGLLNRLKLPFDGFQGDGISVWLFTAVSLVAGLLSVKSGKLFSLSHKTKSVTLYATLFGKEITLRAMIDTGNLLKDPVSGRSVIAVEWEALAPALPPPLYHALQKDDCAAWMVDPDLARLVRPIPAKTATGTGVLAAISPDALFAQIRGERIPCNHLLAPTTLGGTAHGFDAVIAPL